MPRTPIWQVDAFTDRPFAGNPAAVAWLDAQADPAWMQHVASEMNLAVTAFVHPRPDGDGYGLRWFTPAAEVDLCGHATLAAAHALWEAGRIPAGPIRFHTRSGVLTCQKNGDRIELDFPSTPPQASNADPQLLVALGAFAAYFGRTRFDVFVELDSAETVRSLRPDFRALKALDARGIIATARSDDPKYDFISRFFAPAVGIDEDPVTGSAHCALAPYWAAKLGKPALTGFQASPRGGIVGVRVNGDRVILSGQAVTVLEGTLLC